MEDINNKDQNIRANTIINKLTNRIPGFIIDVYCIITSIIYNNGTYMQQISQDTIKHNTIFLGILLRVSFKIVLLHPYIFYLFISTFKISMNSDWLCF